MPMSLDQPITSHQLPLVLRAVRDGNRVLTADALGFLGELQRRFGMKLHALMIARQRRQDGKAHQLRSCAVGNRPPDRIEPREQDYTDLARWR